MKFQLFKDGNTYTAVLSDETKMIPDPAFVRQYEYSAPVPPQQEPNETAADFAQRQQAHTQAVADQEAMIEREAPLRYQTEFAKPAPVLVNEKVIP